MNIIHVYEVIKYLSGVAKNKKINTTNEIINHIKITINILFQTLCCIKYPSYSFSLIINELITYKEKY